MKKIGNIYILTEKEMDALRYELDKCRKYKILAEMEWEKADEEDSEDVLQNGRIFRSMDSTDSLLYVRSAHSIRIRKIKDSHITGRDALDTIQ